MRAATAFAAGVLAGVLAMSAAGTTEARPESARTAPMGVRPLVLAPTPAAPAIADPAVASQVPASRPPAAQPDPSPVAVRKATPKPRSARETARGGLATWYAAPAGTAAAGPELRRALGKRWRGSLVDVCAGGRCVQVRLTDWCACGRRNGSPTLIDLGADSFALLAPLGRGVLRVEVRP